MTSTILEKIKVPHVLTHYGPYMKNSIGKSVTVLKLLNRAIDCRQAEPCSSIRLDFIPKRVKMSIPRNGQKNREKSLEAGDAGIPRIALPKHAAADASSR